MQEIITGRLSSTFLSSDFAVVVICYQVRCYQVSENFAVVAMCYQVHALSSL